MRDLRRVVAPFASSVAPSDAITATVEPEAWVRTGPGAVRVRPPVPLDPTAAAEPLPGEEPGPHTLVLALSGRFQSFWADRVPPPGVDAAEVERDGRPARMVVAGSADLVANNPALVENALDWLLDDPALIDVRTRGGGTPPLDAPSPGAALWLKAAIVGLPLLLLALIGLVVRRRER